VIGTKDYKKERIVLDELDKLWTSWREELNKGERADLDRIVGHKMITRNK